jgi:Putative GTPase activating protein for Arf
MSPRNNGNTTTTTTTNSNSSSNSNTKDVLVSQVARELESMRCDRQRQQQRQQKDDGSDAMEFPTAARHLVYGLPGNHACMDCGAAHPSWASISFGTLLCLQCSGHHRGFGVQTSRVQSIDLDSWSHAQILALLEGGNRQLQQFFDRHSLGNSTPMASTRQRYHTKAARFYRVHLAHHVNDVANAGIYQGREATRQQKKNHTSTTTSNNNNNNNNVGTSPSEPAITRSIAVAQ